MPTGNGRPPTSEDLEAHKKLHTAGSRISGVILNEQAGSVNILGVVLGLPAASGKSKIIIAAAMDNLR